MAVDVKTPKGYQKAWNGSHVPDKAPNWCRDERLQTGRDALVEQRDGYTLVRVIGEFASDNIHAGKWIVWAPDGRCATVGSEPWARKRFDALTNSAAFPVSPTQEKPE